jgi:hypothetical protein
MSHITRRRDGALKTLENRTTVSSEQLTHARYVLGGLLTSVRTEQGKKDYQEALDLLDAEICKRDM